MRLLPLPSALAAGTVLSILGAAPALAATADWDGPTGGGDRETSTAVNWVGDTLPAAGDDWRFGTGDYAHNSLAVDAQVAGLTFDAPGFLLAGTRFELGALGLTALQSAETNADIRLTASQRWSVAAGSTLLNRGEILVTTGELELAPAGTIEFRGRLDGVGGAGAVTQSSGTVLLSGSGGTIGAGGYRIVEGTTHVTGMLGGTDVVLAGGDAVLSGSGVVRTLSGSAGLLSPGPEPGGDGIGELESWNTVALTPAHGLRIDVDATSSDRLQVYLGADLGGALLDLRVPVGVDPVARTTIVQASSGTVVGSLAGVSGTLTIGETFEASGHRWRLEQPDASTLDLVWVERIAVVPPPPVDEEPIDEEPVDEEPAPSPAPSQPTAPSPAPSASPELAATGSSPASALVGVAALLLLAGGIALLARPRRA